MKRLFPLLWLTLIALSISTTACRSITETDPATPIEAKTGKEFTIVIQSNPSTGYEWQLTDPLDKTIVQFVEKEYQADEPVIPGSGGWDIWTFKAAGPGETEITLGHFPPGETAAQQTTTFTVIVQ